MKFKPHQIPQIADGMRRVKDSLAFAKKTLEHPNFEFKGSVFSYILILRSNIQEKIIYCDVVNDFAYSKGPFFPTLSFSQTKA